MSGIKPEILKESLNFKIAALGNRNSYSDHKKNSIFQVFLLDP